MTALTMEVRGLHTAAYLLASFALLSQLLALLRDRLLAASFGAGETLDIYYAAFRLPDLLFVGVASLLSLYALLPVLAKLEEEAPGRAVGFLSRSLLFFFVTMGAVAGLAYLFAPALVPLIAPGIASPELVGLTRILLLQPILLGASNILAALTQLRHRFLLYSVSPLLYNFGIIAGILFLYPTMGVAGLGWGVVLGAILHVVVQVPFFGKEARSPVPFARVFLGLREALVLSVPRTLALSAGQISLVILTALASHMVTGSIAVFMFAWNLQAVPLVIIGVSYSVAAFPTLASLYARQEREEFLRHMETALRHILFWAVPATLLCVVLRAQLVRAILGAGAFDWQDTRLVAAALALFVLSLAAQSVSLLVARGYYAAGVTSRPLLFALVSVAVAVGSALALLFVFSSFQPAQYFLESLLRVEGIPGTEVLMLALGYCLGAVAAAVVGLAWFAKDFSMPLLPLRRLGFETFAAAVIGSGCAYGALALLGGSLNLDTLSGILLQGLAGGVAGLAATALVLVVLRNREVFEVAAALRRRLGPSPVALEPTDVSS